MGNEIKEHIERGLEAQQMRLDGRKPDEFRSVTVEKGFSKNAEGSARVKIGDTEVIAGVKLSVEEPYPDTPEEGKLMVGVELTPMASPEFESGPPSAAAVEMARVVDRGIRESKAIDSKKLCIKKREKVWTVMIDIVAVNDDGNLMDACGLASIAALMNTVFPSYDGETLDYKNLTKDKLPLKEIPIPVTVFKIGNNLVVDPTTEEQEVAEGRITVIIQQDGKLCAMQKGGSAALSMDELKAMVGLGIKKAKELSAYVTK